MVELILVLYTLGFYLSLKWIFKKALKDFGGFEPESSTFNFALINAIFWPIAVPVIFCMHLKISFPDKIIKHFKL